MACCRDWIASVKQRKKEMFGSSIFWRTDYIKSGLISYIYFMDDKYQPIAIIYSEVNDIIQWQK